MFLIRSIERRDLASFFRLAAILNTYNLPKDKRLLARVIRTSLASFGGRLAVSHQGRYVFVAEEADSGRVVGTSEILAKRGTADKPFIFCEVGEETMKSRTLNKVMTHRYIRLRSTHDGPTEIGGLVVAPRYRGRKLGIGKALSYVRLMYAKAYPARFQKRILAEILAYLNVRGENPLWDVLGRHFTGLSYREADRLSVENKEFILSLFPSEKIYTCLLPERVQDILEKPGPSSVPAEILLKRIGFRYLRRVDPFDGGPLYGARTNEITVIRDTHPYKFLGSFQGSPRSQGLLMHAAGGRVRACLAGFNISGRGVYLESSTASLLALSPREKVWVYAY